ncbi:MAG: hypothetical protein JW751_21435 [Polyangiaceae bacterium]|nr:hypothetical protein [Polyangiaceae bacterium]
MIRGAREACGGLWVLGVGLVACGGSVSEAKRECDPGQTRSCDCSGRLGVEHCLGEGIWESVCDCGDGGSPVAGASGLDGNRSGGTANLTGGAGAEPDPPATSGSGGMGQDVGGSPAVNTVPSSGGAAGTGAPLGSGGMGGSPAPTGGDGPGGAFTVILAGPDALIDERRDYAKCGPWSGYLWTGTEEPSLGSTISPETFHGRRPGDEFCVTGTVAAHPEFATVAELGYCVNQSSDGGDESIGGWDPTGYSGIAYELTSEAGTNLRLRVVGLAGYPEEAWCAPIEASTGRVPWAALNERCWDDSGGWYDGKTPIASVRIVVFGDDDQAVDFDFCLRYLAPY